MWRPRNDRDWKRSDDTFYDRLAPELHHLGILCGADLCEPGSVCAAHGQACLAETPEKLEIAVDATIEKLKRGGHRTAAR